MSLKKESYEIVLTGRGLRALDRLVGHGNIGRKNRFLAPGDYAPGKDDDASEGYMPGSRLSNEDGDVFMCVHSEEGKANWVKIASMDDATEGSYVNMEEMEEVEEIAPEPYSKHEVPEENEAPGVQEDSGSGKMTFEVEAGPNKSVTAIPDDMPWGKFLKKNDLKNIEAVQRLSDRGELADLKYLNEDRAEDIAEWLENN